MERQQESHIAPGPVSEVQAVVPTDPLGQSLAAARAPGADASATRSFVDALARLDLGSPRATADRLEQLLGSGELEPLRASDGTSARAVAVERLLGLGYPYALEVSPEDLAYWRAERPSEATDGRGLAALVMTVAVCLALWGLSEPPTGVGLATVLGLLGVTVAGLLRPRARRWAQRTLFILSIVACAIGVRYGIGTLLPGVAGVVTARFIWPRGVRGLD